MDERAGHGREDAGDLRRRPRPGRRALRELVHLRIALVAGKKMCRLENAISCAKVDFERSARMKFRRNDFSEN